MGTRDLADLLVQVLDKVQFYWNFYVVLLIAIIGWLISTKRPLTTSLKGLVTVGYLVFVLMNVSALREAYALAEALRLDLISSLSTDGTTPARHAVQILSESSYAQQRRWTLWIHGILGAALLSILWLGRFGQASGETEE